MNIYVIVKVHNNSNLYISTEHNSTTFQVHDFHVIKEPPSSPAMSEICLLKKRVWKSKCVVGPRSRSLIHFFLLLAFCYLPFAYSKIDVKKRRKYLDLALLSSVVSYCLHTQKHGAHFHYGQALLLCASIDRGVSQSQCGWSSEHTNYWLGVWKRYKWVTIRVPSDPYLVQTNELVFSFFQKVTWFNFLLNVWMTP